MSTEWNSHVAQGLDNKKIKSFDSKFKIHEWHWQNLYPKFRFALTIFYVYFYFILIFI